MVKFFTKIVCMAFIATLCVSNIFAQENLSDITPDSMGQPAVDLSFSENFIGDQTSRAMWDILFDFNAPAGAHVAIATDGTNFYTTTWNTTLPTPGPFQKYDMEGNMVGSTFTIAGVGETRSLTYDGQYFYSGHNSTTIRILDLANQTLIGTITAPNAVRHITYDPTLDSGNGGFWIGDWGNIRSITKTGTAISSLITFQSGNYPSCYGTAFDNITDPDHPCVWLNTQEGSVNQGVQETKIYKFDINTLSLVPGIQHNCKDDYPDLNPPNGPLGGGAFAYEWDGKWCLVVDMQVTPNKIAIYELAVLPDCDPAKNLNVVYEPDCSKATLTWDAPDKKDVTTYNVYRDGEKIAGPIEDTTFEDTTFEETKGYKWSVKVICDSGNESFPVSKTLTQCYTPPPPCNPITGGKAVVACETAVLTWTAVTGAKEYEVTRDGNTVTVTEPTYTETGTFEDGETYKWMVKTICDANESTEVEVKGVADCYIPAVNELFNSVAIFPNPSSGTVTITAKDFAKVEVYNTVGQLIETRTINTVDVSSYNTGIYFFKVYDSNNNSVTKRVMVTK